MENGFESWFRDQQIDWQSPNPNSSSAPFGLGPRLMVPSFGNTFSAHEPRKASIPEEPRGWFYGLPRYRQGFNSVPRVDPKSQLPVRSPNENCKNGVQKKFLVFDQSGDQTTLIYSSGVGSAPFQCHLPPLNDPKLQSAFDLKKSNIMTNRDEDIRCSYPFCVEDHIEDDSKSEMREDTEELNALLYSDDDETDDSENEETSTGHSPSTMTGFDKQEFIDENGDEEEEVASSGGPGKRHKLENGGYNVISTASSGKSCVNCSNDGELSSCGVKNGVFEEDCDSLSSGNKRLRKEKVRETVGFLRNLIPGGQDGKDAMMVIDEAIHYLRSLKVKAKALGLDSL